MLRLLLLAAPVACIGTGAVLGLVMDWCLSQYYHSEADNAEIGEIYSLKSEVKSIYDVVTNGRGLKEKKKGVNNISHGPKNKFDLVSLSVIKGEFIRIVTNIYRSMLLLRQGTAVIVIVIMYITMPGLWKSFSEHSEKLAYTLSSPKIIIKTSTKDHGTIIIDDYREAYFWLKDRTPQDSRVMAWWDYGYQITGIGNRTSIADGNTWNHEHIATLGKILTSPVKEAHSYIRHLADYVLIWAGQFATDIHKSPHMARIANSVYRNICPKDPMCSHYAIRDNDPSKPTPMMKKSLLYNLHSVGIMPDVKVDGKLFQHVFSSKYGLVRIFKVMNVSQESKDWVADPANRKCDFPGSWHCPGQYPPAKPIQSLLRTRLDFAQLEDFNREKRDDNYVEEYLKRLRTSDK